VVAGGRVAGEDHMTRPTIHLAPPTDTAEVPRLVRAGWDVVLDGRRVTCSVGAEFPRLHAAVAPCWADTRTPFDPAAFGWPQATP